MKCSCSCSWTPVLALAGLAALGLGGYNMVRTGCPLGTCSSETPSVTVAPASLAAGASDCADKADCCGVECDKTMTSECPLCPEGRAKLLTTSDTSATDCQAKTECEGKTECPAAKLAEKGPVEPPKN